MGMEVPVGYALLRHALWGAPGVPRCGVDEWITALQVRGAGWTARNGQGMTGDG